MTGFPGGRYSGYVYFIGCGEHNVVKIGWGTNPWTRMDSFQTGNHELLKMYAAYRVTNPEGGEDLVEPVRYLDSASQRRLLAFAAVVAAEGLALT